MILSNIHLEKNVDIDKTSSVNNVIIGKNTRIASNVRVFGAVDHLLEVGESCYIGPGSVLEGYNAKVVIGSFVSFAQNINLMSGSGPNASELLQRIFPLIKGEVHIGNHSWIGASVIIMPGIKLGNFCIVAANSFVNNSFPEYSIIGGNPAKIIRKLTEEEINKLQ